MTPEFLALIGGLIDRYGLPIAILIGSGLALWRRVVVMGSELAYVEARRLEERTGRLEAEAALRAQTDAMRDLAEAQKELTESLLPRPRSSRA